MEDNIMLTVSKEDGQLDCPEGMRIYFNDIKRATDYATGYIDVHNYYLAVLRRINNGHYRTLKYIHNPKLV